jgi:hypothetical protein
MFNAVSSSLIQLLQQPVVLLPVLTLTAVRTTATTAVMPTAGCQLHQEQP